MDTKISKNETKIFVSLFSAENSPQKSSAATNQKNQFLI